MPASGRPTRDRPEQHRPFEPDVQPPADSSACSTGEGVAVAVGIARGTLDLYEEVPSRTRTTMTAPIVPMSQSPQYHRCYGEAVALVDVAELGLLGS